MYGSVAARLVFLETWQSWFNAPDLKSDEGASPPGVRIPASPPISERYLEKGTFFCLRCRRGGLQDFCGLVEVKVFQRCLSDEMRARDFFVYNV